MDHHQQPSSASSATSSIELSNLSQAIRQESNSNKSIHHMQRIKHDPLTPHHLLVNTITNLSDFNTPLREPSSFGFSAPKPAATLQPIMESQPIPLNEDIELPTGSASPAVASIHSFTTEQKLFMGEVLYTLRPVIYALILHSLRHKSANDQNDSEKDSNDNTTSAVSVFGQISYEVGMYNKSKKLLQNLWSVLVPALGTELAWKALALLISFAIEFASIQLSSKALQELRKQANKQALDQSIQNLVNSRSQGDQRNTPQVVDELKERFTADSVDSINNGFINKPSALHSFDLEIQRRRMALYFYLLRSPLFDR